MPEQPAPQVHYPRPGRRFHRRHWPAPQADFQPQATAGAPFLRCGRRRNDGAIRANDHRFHFARLNQRRVLVRILIIRRSIIGDNRFVRRVVGHVFAVIRPRNIDRLLTGRDQGFLFRTVRKSTGNTIVDRLVLIRHGSAARIFRLDLDRLGVGANHNRFAGITSAEEVIADPAQKDDRTGDACQNKAAPTANRTIAICIGSAAEIVLRLHRGALAVIAAFHRLRTLSRPVIIEVVFISERPGFFRLGSGLRAGVSSGSGSCANADCGCTHGSAKAGIGIRHVAGSAFAENILESPVGFALGVGFCSVIRADRVEDFRKFGFEIGKGRTRRLFAVIDFRQIKGVGLLDLSSATLNVSTSGAGALTAEWALPNCGNETGAER